MLARMQRKRNPPRLLVGMKASTDTMKNRMEVTQKLKTDLPFDPVIPPLSTYPKELNSAYYRDMCMFLFIVAQFLIAKIKNL